MNCPHCQSKDLAQVWTRQTDPATTRRRRVCLTCGGKFYTVEQVEGVMAPEPVAPRGPAGSRNVAARLTEDQVRELRESAGRGTGREQLAQQFGVSKDTVSRIIRRKLWAHV